MKRSAVLFKQNVLTRETLNPNILKTAYAVRGQVVILADKIRQEMKSGVKKPFNDIVYCNIGNPQQLGQQHLTFFRNVLSSVLSPELIGLSEQHKFFKPDVARRARTLLSNIDGNSGAYTHSQGMQSVRQNVSDFIKKRDGVPQGPQLENIFLTDGASVGVRLMIQALIRNSNDGIMIPIPQYPLYSAGIAICGGQQVNYYLDEKNGWGLSMAELERSYAEASKKGVNVRALAIINPGNPTGQVLSLENMKNVVEFCSKRNILLMADEVYQENIYTEKKPFYSFNRVVEEMGLGDSFELISFHSVSKGFLGECGRRGGYFVASRAFDKQVLEELYKCASINLCPNVDGQVTVDLMVKPPHEESKEQYLQERDAIIQSLKRRAQNLVTRLNTLPGVSCNQAEGAMYAFPKITIPAAAVAEAKKLNQEPDMFYSLTLLRETGIVVVPGSGFGQEPGTFHFRTTFLPPENRMEEVAERLSKFHVEFMNKYEKQ